MAPFARAAYAALRLLAAMAIVTLAANAAHGAPSGATTELDGYGAVGFQYSSGSLNEFETGDADEIGEEGISVYKYDIHSRDVDNTPNVTAGTAISFPVAGIIGSQLDFTYSHSQASNYDSLVFVAPDHIAVTDYSGSGHLFARTDRWLGGAFVGAESANGARLGGGGVEGQYYDGRFTFQGVVGAAEARYPEHFYCFNLSCDSWAPYAVATRVDGRYFFADNLSLDLDVGYADERFNQNEFPVPGSYVRERESGALWTVGATGQFQFPHSPIVALISYEHGAAIGNYGLSFAEGGASGLFQNIYSRIPQTNDVVLIGARWSFRGSLFSRDRHGASLSSFREVFGDGMFGRLFGQGLPQF